MSNTKYFSSKQENTISKFLGWSVVTGSGSRSTHPGDIQSTGWLGECKTHETPGHRIIFYQSVWKKIQDEAISKYRFPALFVDDGSQKVENTWVMYYSVFPSMSYRMIPYPFSFKTNVSFKSLDMMQERNKYGLSTPVIFVLGFDINIVNINISTLVDFRLMFGSFS